jgi:hypothetical protein
VPAVTHEKCEQSKLSSGQRHLGTATGGESVLFVDEQPLDLEDLRDRASPTEKAVAARGPRRAASSSSITTTRPIGPIGERLSRTLPGDRLKNRCASG